MESTKLEGPRDRYGNQLAPSQLAAMAKQVKSLNDWLEELKNNSEVPSKPFYAAMDSCFKNDSVIKEIEDRRGDIILQEIQSPDLTMIQPSAYLPSPIQLEPISAATLMSPQPHSARPLLGDN